MAGPAPWQASRAPSNGGGTTPCVACNPRPPTREVAINAFHLADDAAAEAAHRSMTNGTAVPADFAGLVALAQCYKAQGPIIQLSISCHGTLGALYEEDGGYRVEVEEPMGRLHIGSRNQILDASALSSDPVRQQAIQLGECVEVAGRIIWQACFIGHPDGGDFLRAFSLLAPHVTVLGSEIETNVGADALRGPARSFERSGSFRDMAGMRALQRDYSAEVCRNGRCVRTSTSLYGRTLLR